MSHSTQPVLSPDNHGLQAVTPLPQTTIAATAEGLHGHPSSSVPVATAVTVSWPANEQQPHHVVAVQAVAVGEGGRTQGLPFTVATSRRIAPMSVEAAGATSDQHEQRQRAGRPSWCSCLAAAFCLAFTISLIASFAAGNSSSSDDSVDDSTTSTGSGGSSDYADNSYQSPHTHAYSSGGASYITVSSPTEGSSFVHGENVPVEWTSLGITVDEEEGVASVDVYYCTSGQESGESCYNNADCTYLGKWYDSYRAGTLIFSYTVGKLYVCLEDDFYTSPFGYSGGFTMSANRRLRGRLK